MDKTARPRRLSRSRADLATPADEPELRRLLREAPVPGQVSVAYTREPDFFRAAAVEGEEHQTIVRRDPAGRIIAMGNRSVRTSFINGQPGRLGYLGQLRVDGQYRSRPGLVASGVARLRDIHAEDSVRLYVATVTETNHTARRMLEARLPGWPIHRPLDTLVTWLIPLRRGRSFNGQQSANALLHVSMGSSPDLGEIAQFLQRHHAQRQFAPCWTEAELRSDVRCRDLHAEHFLLVREQGALVGCLALWDQRGFKQHVVTAYSPALARQRPVLNLLSRFSPVLRLPAPGTPFAHAFVSHLAVDGDRPDVLQALLDGACRQGHGRSLDAMTLGLGESHPLCPVMRRLTRAMEYRSTLYVAFWEDGQADADALDGRIPHVEVALL